MKSKGTEEELEANQKYSEDEMWQQKEIYAMKLAGYRLALEDCRAKEKAWQKNKRSMFNLVLRHCSGELLGKLERLDEWTDVKHGGTCFA